jgi:nucleotide-binding universal stress UspA family protein
MKNILLLAHDDGGQEARLQVALDIVRGLNGHLSCIDVVQIPVLAGDYYSGIGDAMLLDDARQREDENRAAMTARLTQEDVSWDWQDAVGDLDQCILKAARLADLIVLNRKLDADPVPDMRLVATKVALKARRPVVAVPDSQTGFNIRGRALVAWDGSDAAANTLVSVVPLLQKASIVRVLVADDGTIEGSASDAATYLSRHGVHAEIHVVKGGLTTTDRLIANQAKQWRADYVVMGAFSHRPAMEFLFGGVTRHMLNHSPIALVFGH